MKSIKRHILTPLAIIVTAILAFSCMEILDIIFPENPQVNSEIEITVIARLNTETDETAKMIFAALFPKSWKASENISATLTTEGYVHHGYPDVTDQPMSLVNPSDVEPITQLPWVTAYQSEIGFMENKGDVEWVVFESQETFITHDVVSNKAPITGTVKLKVKTGPDNIKYFFAAAWASKRSGFGANDGRYKANETAKVLEVTGGTGASYDFTVLPVVSTIPGVLRYGDMFSVCFESKVENTETELFGVEEIYLMGEATLNDGTVLKVDKVSADNMMKKKGDVSFYKYIYPKAFFNVPEGKEITDLRVYFTNKDNTKSVWKNDEKTEMFQIVQNAE